MTWLLLFVVVAVLVAIYLLARLPGRADVEGSISAPKSPDVGAAGHEGPDIKPEEQKPTQT